MASRNTPKISKKALGMIDTKQSDDSVAMRERDKQITMLEIFGGDEQKTAIANRVSDLMAKGYNDNKIIDTIRYEYGIIWTVRKLGVVKRMINKIWMSEMANNMETYKARELAVIDVMMSEAWESFEKSKHAKHTKKRKEDSDGCEQAGTKYNLTEEIVDEDDAAGDPRYLQILQKLSEQRADLLGLKSKEDKNASGSGTTNIQFNVVGDSATAKSADLLSIFMNMGAGMIPQQKAAQTVEDANAEVVETNPNPVVRDIDEMAEDMLRQYMS